MKLRLNEDYVIDTDDYRKEGLRIAIPCRSLNTYRCVREMKNCKASREAYTKSLRKGKNS